MPQKMPGGKVSVLEKVATELINYFVYYNYPNKQSQLDTNWTCSLYYNGSSILEVPSFDFKKLSLLSISDFFRPSFGSINSSSTVLKYKKPGFIPALEKN
jgi:hypothetical protein